MVFAISSFERSTMGSGRSYTALHSDFPEYIDVARANSTCMF
jgi:hypothetical protein